MNSQRPQWAAVLNERYIGTVAWDAYCVEQINAAMPTPLEWVYVGDMPEHIVRRRVSRKCRASVLRLRFDFT